MTLNLITAAGVILALLMLAWRMSSRLLDVERRCAEAERRNEKFYFEIERLESSNKSLRERLREHRQDYVPPPVAVLNDYRGLASGATYPTNRGA